MKRPAQLFKPSPRTLPSQLLESDYLEHDDVVYVHHCGKLLLQRRKNLFAARLHSLSGFAKNPTVGGS